jgi:hypothetical protein
VELEATVSVHVSPYTPPSPSVEIGMIDAIPVEHREELWSRSVCDWVYDAIHKVVFKGGNTEHEWFVRVEFPHWELSQPYDGFEENELHRLAQWFGEIAHNLTLRGLNDLGFGS